MVSTSQNQSRHPRLYVVATPIGNLEDITARALRVLAGVDMIAAEDTRHSAKLLLHFGIGTPLTSLHEHNERKEIPRLLAFLQAGKSIALISDAGTPLVSDPGFLLVRAAREHGIDVVPVPGACAAIAALSIAGLACSRFVFEGFPPPKPAARRAFFAAHARDPRTLVYYESPHRLAASLADMQEAFGAERPAAVARELTKQFETVHRGRLQDVRAAVLRGDDALKGEFVVLISGYEGDTEKMSGEHARQTLSILAAELPTSQAVSLAAKITGAPKNRVYQWALELKAGASDQGAARRGTRKK